MSFHGMQVPKGDPDRIDKVAGNLKTIASDLHSNGHAVHVESGGMHKAWNSPAGRAAAQEADKLGGAAISHAGDINHGGHHLKTYAHALRHAQKTIKKLISDAQAAESAATSHARTVAAQHHTYLTEGELASVGTDAVAPYLAEYHHEILTLKAAGRKCGAALEKAVPGYKKGMSAAQIQANSYNSVASTLPELAEQRGKQLAKQALPYLNHGKHLPPWLLAQIEQFRKSAFFARGFLTQIPPKILRVIPESMRAQSLDEKHLAYNMRLLGDLGNMLALTTQDHSPAELPDSYINDLLAPIEQKDPRRSAEYLWSVSQLLAVTRTPFGRKFLDRVGNDFYKVDKAGVYLPQLRPVVPVEGTSDHDTGLFLALSHNAHAAQDFFDDNARLKFYVAERPSQYYADGGKALGSALQTATTTYRKGADGLTSAQITNDLINTIGGHDRSDPNWLTSRELGNLKPAVGDILVNYVHSVNGSIVHNLLAQGHLGPYEDGSNGFDQVNFNVAYLKGTMRDIFNDPLHGGETYRKLASASLADSRATMLGHLDRAPNFAAAHQNLRDDLSNAGHSLGVIFNARSHSLADQGAGKDAFDSVAQHIAGGFESVVQGAAEIPGGPASGIAVGEGLNKVNNMIWPTDNEDRAIDARIAQMDPTVTSSEKGLDPERVDQRLQKLYNQGHPTGTSMDEKQTWQEFGDGFKAECAGLH